MWLGDLDFSGNEYKTGEKASLQEEEKSLE